MLEVVQTSTWSLSEHDILAFTTKDTGPGGQHRNKTESCVILRHVPTGIEAKASSRSQHANRRTAREMLEARVAALMASRDKSERNQQRSSMIGSGQRGDKIRTYRVHDDQVTDHRTDRKVRLSLIIAGRLELLQ